MIKVHSIWYAKTNDFLSAAFLHFLQKTEIIIYQRISGWEKDKVYDCNRKP